jgi:tetratricopeptide (TPR) repeat protein
MGGILTDDSSHEVPPEAFARFLEAKASGAEKTAIVQHLLGGCGICRQRFARTAAEPRFRHLKLAQSDGVVASFPANAYDEAFAAAERALVREIERQDRSLDSLLAELDGMPAAEREMKVRNGRRFASPQLALALVDRSYEKRHDDPAAMLHYARLAVAAAERSGATAAGGQALLHDCRARAWSQLGSSHRVRSEMADAEQSFAAARGHLEAGSGDLDLRARVLTQVSTLRIYQRRFEDATTLLEEVTRLHRALHDRRGEAEALITLGMARVYAFQIEAAIPTFNRAVSLLHEHEADLLRGALLNLAWCYAEMRLSQQAHALVPILEKHFAACTEEVTTLRFDWLRGVIERDIGLYLSAEQRLSWARSGFMNKELPFESALISLDLAEVYVQQERLPEAMRTVGEAIPILEGLGVARDLLGALLKLRELAGQQQAAVAVLREVAQAVKGGAAQASP